MVGTYTIIIIYYWASKLQFKIALLAHGTHSSFGVHTLGWVWTSLCTEHIWQVRDSFSTAFEDHSVDYCLSMSSCIDTALYYHCLMSRSQLKVPRMVLPASTTFSGFDNTSPLSLRTWMQGHAEVLSPPQWTPLIRWHVWARWYRHYPPTTAMLGMPW